MSNDDTTTITVNASAMADGILKAMMQDLRIYRNRIKGYNGSQDVLDEDAVASYFNRLYVALEAMHTAEQILALREELRLADEVFKARREARTSFETNVDEVHAVAAQVVSLVAEAIEQTERLKELLVKPGVARQASGSLERVWDSMNAITAALPDEVRTDEDEEDDD